MLKGILRIYIMIFLGSGACSFLIASIKTLKGESSSIGLSIFLFAVSIFFSWLCVKFWNVTKGNESKITRQSESKSVYEKLKNGWAVRSKIPPEKLKQMEQQYAEVLDDLRILRETMELMKSTKNMVTFIERNNLACRMALSIEQAKTPDMPIDEKIPSFKEVRELAEKLLPVIINDSYLKMKMDTFQLKTKEGQLKRFENHLNLLKKYESDLNFASNYERTISKIEDDIRSLKNS